MLSHMEQHTRERLARLALRANAAFSFITGLSLLLFADPLSQLMGATWPLVFQVIGAGLLPFALAVALTAQRKPLRPMHVAVISIMDAIWVLGTLVLAVGWPTALNATGWLVAAAVAVVVDIFCLAQLVGLRRLTQNADPAPGEGRSVLTAERVVAVPVSRAWAVISDVAGYADYAPNIDFSRVVEGEGENVTRECGDGSGRWTEKACLWDEGRAYGFRVQTDAPDYPYPFKVLGGLWEVEPADGGTRVRMRFDLSMKGGLLGDALLAAAIVPKFRVTLEELLDNWELAMGSPAA